MTSETKLFMDFLEANTTVGPNVDRAAIATLVDQNTIFYHEDIDPTFTAIRLYAAIATDGVPIDGKALMRKMNVTFNGLARQMPPKTLLKGGVPTFHAKHFRLTHLYQISAVLPLSSRKKMPNTFRVLDGTWASIKTMKIIEGLTGD